MSRKGREGRRARKRNNSGGENQAFVQSERAAIQKRILRFHATSPFCQGRVDCMFGMGMGPNREVEDDSDTAQGDGTQLERQSRIGLVKPSKVDQHQF